MRSLLFVLPALATACLTTEVSPECRLAITSNGANVAHDRFEAGPASGSWDPSGVLGPTLEGVVHTDGKAQGMSFELIGPPPQASMMYALAPTGGSSVGYGDTPGRPARTWGSTGGTVTVMAVEPSVDGAQVAELELAAVTAIPSTSVSGNTALGAIVLDGTIRVLMPTP